MSIAEVISRTVGPTASKRRTLEREAARIAGELADANRRRHQLSMQAHDRLVTSAGRRDADLDGQIQELRKQPTWACPETIVGVGLVSLPLRYHRCTGAFPQAGSAQAVDENR